MCPQSVKVTATSPCPTAQRFQLRLISPRLFPHPSSHQGQNDRVRRKDQDHHSDLSCSAVEKRTADIDKDERDDIQRWTNSEPACAVPTKVPFAFQQVPVERESLRRPSCSATRSDRRCDDGRTPPGRALSRRDSQARAAVPGGTTSGRAVFLHCPRRSCRWRPHGGVPSPANSPALTTDIRC